MVTFDLDQAIIGVIAVFRSMTARFGLAAAIAALIVLVMRACVALQQVAHHFRKMAIVEFHFFACAVPAGVDRLAIAVLLGFMQQFGGDQVASRVNAKISLPSGVQTALRRPIGS